MNKLMSFGSSFLTAGLLLSASACVENVSTDSAPGEQPPAAKSAETTVAVRVERAARSLDRGENAAAVKAELQAIIADPAASAAELDDATLVLSRAMETLGDQEGAIAVIEEKLAKHAGDREWPASQKTERRLRKLLTGNEVEPKTHQVKDHGPVPPFASALRKYFPEDKPDHYNVRMFSFGGLAEASEKLGTFHVAEAIKQSKMASCGNCELNVSELADHSHWLGIPRYRASLGTSLNVFYYDLADGRIPARYESELPMPKAEIDARLGRGEAFVVAKERVGAPPVILIAAPRFALLDNVEEELSKMTTLPLTPVSVTFNGSLEAEEVQEVVRASFGSFRVCYEAVLQSNPNASGKLTLDFVIDVNGHVTQANATADAALSSMETCMATATQKFVFPAASKQTTVAYPVQFTPGPN